jgi:hypothetical protein
MTLRHDDRGPFVALVEAWVAKIVAENPIVSSVERDPEVDRWYVRVRGDEKAVTTVWITVGEQVVHAESYFMPWPEDNRAETFEYLLRSSQRFYGLRFCIGPEDAVYLRGELPLAALLSGDPNDELDRLLGAIYAYTEDCFRTAMTLTFGDRFRPPDRTAPV